MHFVPISVLVLMAWGVALTAQTVQQNPTSWEAYNQKAAALCRQARYSGDVSLYDQAEAAVRHSLQLSPGNYDTQKIEIAILLGRRDFREALKRAAQLKRKAPDDIVIWGFLTDANIGLGNYVEAERCAQWILDLRRQSTLGFIEAATLRELFGDAEGAIEFFDDANLRTSRNDVEERSWLLTQTARIQLLSGNLKRAAELLDQALALNPKSALAIGVRARLRMAEGNPLEAAALFRQQYQKAADPGTLYNVAEALEKAGRNSEAAEAYQDFELKARSQTAQTYNANRELILFYADHKNAHAEALALAEKEVGLRADAATLDAYAWALYRGHKFKEARAQMDRALAVGVRDPGFFCHASRIAAAVGDTEGAKRFEKERSSLPAAVCTAEPSVKPGAVDSQ